MPKLNDLLGAMPDVAMRDLDQPQGTLDWVGMTGVSQPLEFCDGDQVRSVTARFDVFANLIDPMAKGIHMSRLYGAIDEQQQRVEPLRPRVLSELLGHLLATQGSLSSQVALGYRFDLLLRRPALESGYSGWSGYPALIQATLKDSQIKIELAVSVLYSSTCPCSAALSRQLIQEKFAARFGDQESVSVERVVAWMSTQEGIVATPHGQRSVADARVQLVDGLDTFPLTDLIDRIEGALKTPVQTAVKREDEKAFALLNGRNPKFCEDAARVIRDSLGSVKQIRDYLIRVEHQESLHAHNAVASVSKGIEDGYRPKPQ